MPRHSPCALYSLTYSRFLVLYSWIMQAISTDFSVRKIVIVTHIFHKRCSTIKNSQLLKLSFEKPSVALLSSHFNTLFSFQGASSNFCWSQTEILNLSWTLLSSFKKLVEIVGIEPATSCLQGRRSPSWAISPYHLLFEKWWARVGSNHRPYDYQSYALASWATGPFPTLPQKACAL